MLLRSTHDIFILFISLLIPIVVYARITVYNRHGQVVDMFEDAEASYGSEPFETRRGLVVLADPPDACEPIKDAEMIINSTFARVVLINGSITDECTGPDKAANAENADYDIALIYGAFPSISRDKIEIGIPVLFLHYDDGRKIRERYLYYNGSQEPYIFKISSNSQDIGYYIELFAAVIGVCIIVMVLFMVCLLVKCIQDRRRNQRHRLTASQIKQLPTQKFTPGDNYVDCAICLEDYSEGDKLRTLPCSHAYHAKCIDPWLKNNRRNCPLCKRKIHIGDSSSESSSDSELNSPAENTPLLSSTNAGSPQWGTFGVNRSERAYLDGACNLAVEIEQEPGMSAASGSVNNAEDEEYVNCGEDSPMNVNGRHYKQDNDHSGLIV